MVCMIFFRKLTEYEIEGNLYEIVFKGNFNRMKNWIFVRLWCFEFFRKLKVNIRNKLCIDTMGM